MARTSIGSPPTAPMFKGGLPGMNSELNFRHQDRSDLVANRLRPDFQDDRGVPTRTPMLKLVNARGIRYSV